MKGRERDKMKVRARKRKMKKRKAKRQYWRSLLDSTVILTVSKDLVFHFFIFVCLFIHLFVCVCLFLLCINYSYHLYLIIVINLMIFTCYFRLLTRVQFRETKFCSDFFSFSACNVAEFAAYRHESAAPHLVFVTQVATFIFRACLHFHDSA